MALSPDVDGGWAFVVMLGGCLTQLMTLGLTYTSSIFYATFIDEFQRSPVLTAWTVNINVFIFYITGEVSAVLVGCIGARKTIAIGCCLSTIGLGGCFFVNSLLCILVLYGVFGGIGFAFCYFPIYAVIASYFHRYRVVAFAVSSSGAGLGQFIYPSLLRVSMEAYTWRGAFLILAGLNLNMLVVAAAFMPPRGSQVKKSNSELGPRALLSLQLRKIKDNFELLRMPRWSLWCISAIMCNTGISGFYTHITKYGCRLGYSYTTAAFLPSIVGMGGLIGRLTMGMVAKLPNVHVVGLYISLFATVGVASILVGLVGNFSYVALALGCALCGIGVGAFGVYPEAIIHIIGSPNIAAGVSYSSLSASLGMLLGGPLAAAIYEADPSYRLSFVTVGLITFLGAFFNVPSCCYMKKSGLRFVPSIETQTADQRTMEIEKRCLNSSSASQEGDSA